MAKEPSIEISPKYGTNPMRGICAFCGKENGTIAMLGRIRKKENGRVIRDSDIEAPKTGVIDYTPCDECNAKMNTGITLIGVTDNPFSPLQPAIGKDENNEPMYPTGSWIVVSEEFITRNFTPETAEGMLNAKKCIVPQAVVNDIIAAYDKAEETGSNTVSTGDDDINA